jgi:hypothetical protein
MNKNILLKTYTIHEFNYVISSVPLYFASLVQEDIRFVKEIKYKTSISALLNTYFL